MTSPGRPEYTGSKRQLVLALDVGTTFSGISYCILDPGVVPKILTVTRFPAQEQIGGASKIPTIIYYDCAGQVRAVGAQATRDSIHEEAVDENWIKAEWQRQLIPSFDSLLMQMIQDRLQLPPNMSVVDVLADFFKYLLHCAETFIQETHANGRELWQSVSDDIKYVLSHPNGWEGSQQSKIYEAAVKGGLIPNTPPARDRLSFVTEGEASLHFAIHNGLPVDAMKNGAGVVIVDAGGGTIDISSYVRKVGAWTENFAEVAVTRCLLQGSVFVTFRFQSFIKKFLEGSTFFKEIGHIASCFDRSTKIRFKTDQDLQHVRFGRATDEEEKYNIRHGLLKLGGTKVSQFFQPAIDDTVQAIEEQGKATQNQLLYVIMLGGFSANDWFFEHVSARLSSQKFQVIRPIDQMNKAVSDGGISVYLDNFVQTRVSKLFYGVSCKVGYEPQNPEHQSRLHEVFTDLDGKKRIKGAFSTILGKGVSVLETEKFQHSFFRLSETKSDLSGSVLITCYRGSFSKPTWMDVDEHNYTKLCRIPFDCSHLPLTPHTNGSSSYFRMDYDVILLFGRPELKAQIAWMENGVEVRSAPQIVYDPDY